LKPLVVVPWGKVETQLLGSLEDHTFGEAEMEDFTKEFDMVESTVPEGPDGRGHRNFIKMLVSAVMSFSVDSGKIRFFNKSSHVSLDTNQMIVRSHEADVRDTNFSDCELLLRKYIDNEDDRIEALFVLADIFRKKHENNASKFAQEPADTNTFLSSVDKGGFLGVIRAFNYGDPDLPEMDKIEER
jgi:hypothetical protein